MHYVLFDSCSPEEAGKARDEPLGSIQVLGLEHVDAPSGATTGKVPDILLDCLISIGYKRRPVVPLSGRELTLCICAERFTSEVRRLIPVGASLEIAVASASRSTPARVLVPSRAGRCAGALLLLRRRGGDQRSQSGHGFRDHSDDPEPAAGAGAHKTTLDTTSPATTKRPPRPRRTRIPDARLSVALRPKAPTSHAI